MPSPTAAKRVVTYQFTGHLTRAGHALLDQRLAENSEIYDGARAWRKQAWESNGERVSLRELKRRLKATRGEHQCFDDLFYRIQIGTLERLDEAFQAFFRRVKNGEKPGYPRRKRGRFRTLSWQNAWEDKKKGSQGSCNNLRLDRGRGKGYIRAKGLPRIEFKVRRELPDRQPNIIRITRTARRVVVSLVYVLDDLPKQTSRKPKSPVGIDAGVKNHITLSTGGNIQGRKIDRRRLKRLQRKVSRTDPKLGSRSRRKKVKSLSKEWQRVREAERGAAHELSRKIVDRHDFIAVEDLAIPNMTRSAKGTLEEPGKGVKAKSGLNRSISEQGWGRLYGMIAYKAEWAGKRFVKVDPMFTSQTCSSCVTKDGSSRRSQSEFQCTGCGYAANADVNAAQNILRRGLEQAFGPGETIPGATRTTKSYLPAGVGGRRKPSVRGPTASAMLPGFL